MLTEALLRHKNETHSCSWSPVLREFLNYVHTNMNRAPVQEATMDILAKYIVHIDALSKIKQSVVSFFLGYFKYFKIE